MFKKTAAVLLVVGLSGCFGQRLSVYESRQPRLSLESYFAGCTVGWGAISNWRGETVSQFKVLIKGSVTSQELVLDEDFLYDDGDRSERLWRIRQTQAGHYVGTAADVVGEAAGRVVGNALNWKYKLQVPRGDSSITLTLDDWLYLQPDGVMINQTKLSKFGFPVGSLVITFQNKQEAGLCASPPAAAEWQR